MSIATLRTEVEFLDLPVERDAIIDCFTVLDMLAARLTMAIASFEADGLHQIDGAASMPGWLRQRTKRDPNTAGKITSAGRKLRVLPVLSEAVLDGVISGGQLEIIMANLPARHLDLFAHFEAAFVPILAELPIDQTRHAMEQWRQRADAVNPGPKPPGGFDDEVFLSKTLNARGDLRGSLGSDLTATVDAAFRVADPKDFTLTMAQRRATALGQVCQFFLDHQKTRTGGRHRPHLNVVISYEDFCDANGLGLGATYLDTDQPVSPTALAILKCDSKIHRLLFSATSGILDYGRGTRTWPVDLYNAILVRDQGCRFGDCNAPASWCDVHHVEHWDPHGHTAITNGILACRRHHHLVHTPGYHVKLLPDGTVEFTHPDGRLDTSQPRGLTRRQFWPDPPDQPDGD